MSLFKKLLVLAIVALFAASAPAYAKEEAKGGEGEGKEAASSSDTSFYIRLDPMVLPVINDKGLQEVVSLLVALEVKDQRNVEKVNGMQPKLKDAYVRALYGRLDKTAYRNGKFLDVDKVKAQLAMVTESVLGKGLVLNVLIQGVNQRHFN